MRKDILFGMVDDDYDLLIRNGDFVIGVSDIQHCRHIISAHPGHYKQWPRIGVGIIDDLKSAMDASLTRRILIHLKADTYSPQNLKIRDNAIVLKL